MANIEPRNFPIAAAVVAAIIIGSAFSGRAFGSLPDVYVVLALIIGVIMIIIGSSLYFWDRKRYYETLHLR